MENINFSYELEKYSFSNNTYKSLRVNGRKPHDSIYTEQMFLNLYNALKFNNYTHYQILEILCLDYMEWYDGIYSMQDMKELLENDGIDSLSYEQFEIVGSGYAVYVPELIRIELGILSKEMTIQLLNYEIYDFCKKNEIDIDLDQNNNFYIAYCYAPINDGIVKSTLEFYTIVLKYALKLGYINKFDFRGDK